MSTRKFLPPRPTDPRVVLSLPPRLDGRGARHGGARRARRLERGDVPGWVMVTLMTAGLVIAIWAVAGDALVEVFRTAIDRVLAT